jgi:type IV pilus assembly protein PilB
MDKSTTHLRSTVFRSEDPFLRGMLVMVLFFWCHSTFGQRPTSPEFSTFQSVNSAGVNVDLYTGNFSYSLPVIEIPGPDGGSYALSLSYNNVSANQEASWVGEIRDSDTATMAVRAALTGHLVLSTIHTNSAWGTVARLTDMGVPAYLLSSTLVMSVAQRLVRKLCHCKKKEIFKANMPSGIENFVRVSEHFMPVGCAQCFYTGYRGRVAVYEVIPVTDEFMSSIRSSQQDVSELMIRSKVTSLQQGALELLKNGVTSFEEIYSLILSA